MILAREINKIKVPPTFFILSRAISVPVITPMMFTWTLHLDPPVLASCPHCPRLLSPCHLHFLQPRFVLMPALFTSRSTQETPKNFSHSSNSLLGGILSTENPSCTW